MNRFKKFMPIIFKNEGVLSDDISDSGGLTKYGISQKSYPNLNIRDLTKEQAEQIYYRDYYLRLKLDKIKSDLLALHIFDMGVNAGIYRAVSMLQKVCNVIIDGNIGIKTITAANYNEKTAEKYIQARKDYYISIGVGKNKKFLKGWLNRVNNTTKLL